MADGVEQDEPPKTNASSDTLAAQGRTFQNEEGPGQVGLELSRIKECLRDLGTDNALPDQERKLLFGFYRHQHDRLQLRLAVLGETEKAKSCESALENAKEALNSARFRASRQSPDNLEDDEIRKAESEYSLAEMSLVKACSARQTASEAWERLRRDESKWQGQESPVLVS